MMTGDALSVWIEKCLQRLRMNTRCLFGGRNYVIAAVFFATLLNRSTIASCNRRSQNSSDHVVHRTRLRNVAFGGLVILHDAGILTPFYHVFSPRPIRLKEFGKKLNKHQFWPFSGHHLEISFAIGATTLYYWGLHHSIFSPGYRHMIDMFHPFEPTILNSIGVSLVSARLSLAVLSIAISLFESGNSSDSSIE